MDVKPPLSHWSHPPQACNRAPRCRLSLARRPLTSTLGATPRIWRAAWQPRRQTKKSAARNRRSGAGEMPLGLPPGVYRTACCACQERHATVGVRGANQTRFQRAAQRCCRAKAQAMSGPPGYARTAAHSPPSGGARACQAAATSASRLRDFGQRRNGIWFEAGVGRRQRQYFYRHRKPQRWCRSTRWADRVAQHDFGTTKRHRDFAHRC